MKADLIRCGKEILSTHPLLNRNFFKMGGGNIHMYTLIDLYFKILMFSATGRSLVQRSLQIVDVCAIECDHNEWVEKFRIDNNSLFTDED
jgi:hypothetical protein